MTSSYIATLMVHNFTTRHSTSTCIQPTLAYMSIPSSSVRNRYMGFGRVQHATAAVYYTEEGPKSFDIRNVRKKAIQRQCKSAHRSYSGNSPLGTTDVSLKASPACLQPTYLSNSAILVAQHACPASDTTHISTPSTWSTQPGKCQTRLGTCSRHRHCGSKSNTLLQHAPACTAALHTSTPSLGSTPGCVSPNQAHAFGRSATATKQHDAAAQTPKKYNNKDLFYAHIPRLRDTQPATV